MAKQPPFKRSFDDTSAAAPLAPRLVCLQTMWRSCGTYIFNRFRANESVYPYFEPCSEWLLARSPEAIYETFRQAPVDLRHTGPSQRLNMFPFRADGGVEGFRKRFPFQNFYLSRDDDDPDLKRYVDLLVRHAIDQGRVPVAKCCRFGMRAEWLARACAARSVYVLRDPDHVFRSYWSFGGIEESYFLSACTLIIAKNRGTDPFRELADELQIPAIADGTIAEELAAASRIARALTAQDHRDIVLLLWAGMLVQNCLASELILDVDLMISSSEYRMGLERDICRLFGFDVSLADVERRATPDAPGLVLSERGVACARNAVVDLAAGRAVPVCSMSAATAYAAERVLP